MYKPIYRVIIILTEIMNTFMLQIFGTTNINIKYNYSTYLCSYFNIKLCSFLNIFLCRNIEQLMYSVY